MKKTLLLLALSLLSSGCSLFKTPTKQNQPTAWAGDVVGQQIREDHEKNEKNFKKTKRMVEDEK